MIQASIPPLPPELPRISDYVDWHAQHTPDAEAMALGGWRISYAAFKSQVDALSHALLKAGVRKGDRIATLAPPSPEYFIAFLAAASIGAIWVGLNPRYQREELAYVLEDSAPRILIARSRIDGRDYTPDLVSLCERTPSIERLLILEREGGEVPSGTTGVSDFIDEAGPPDEKKLMAVRNTTGGRDACMIVYTSGSTGRPKGAMLHHEGVIAFSLEQNRVWPVYPMRVLNFFPINHIGCVVDVSTPTLVRGGTIVFLEHFSPQQSLQLIQDERITLWGSVPSTFQLQLAEPDFSSYDFSAVQLIGWGGAAMPRETLDSLAAFGRPMATNYGLTESGSAITAIAPTRDLAELEKTVGIAFPGTEIRLMGPDGREVANGEAGEIQARARHTMLGYWRRPEATAETLREDGWLATGDLGRRNPDGSYSIVGRLKEMYKSGGYNVYPREVEMVIESHPQIEVAAVVSAPDPVWQEVGIAYIIGNGPLDLDVLRAFCRERLANYKIPKRFVPVDDMPLLPIGKIDKVALRKRAAKEYAPKIV